MSSSPTHPNPHIFAYTTSNRGGRDMLSISYFLHRSKIENMKSSIDNKPPKTILNPNNNKPKKRSNATNKSVLNGDLSKLTVEHDRCYNYSSQTLHGFINSPRTQSPNTSITALRRSFMSNNSSSPTTTGNTNNFILNSRSVSAVGSTASSANSPTMYDKGNNSRFVLSSNNNNTNPMNVDNIYNNTISNNHGFYHSDIPIRGESYERKQQPIAKKIPRRPSSTLRNTSPLERITVSKSRPKSVGSARSPSVDFFRPPSTSMSAYDFREIEETASKIEKQSKLERKSNILLLGSPRERFLKDPKDIDIYNSFISILSKLPNDQLDEMMEGIRKAVLENKLLKTFGEDDVTNI
ncbi:hypothetical protein ABK040_004211 [Willaertia magna]